MVSTKARPNSTRLWADVVVNVTFTLHPTISSPAAAALSAPPTVMVMPAFWDGDSIWRVRFSPPAAGTWGYTTVCNDPTDSGLDNVRGSFNAAKSVTPHSHSTQVPPLVHSRTLPDHQFITGSLLGDFAAMCHRPLRYGGECCVSAA
jgi:hypothetical protein